jgi:uncharacterized Zn finger protein (UPF0148 family)
MPKICDKHNLKYTKQSGIMRCPECRREAYLKYDRKNRERRKKWRQSEAGKTSQKRYKISSKQKNYYKNIARNRVNQAIKSGHLVRPSVCSKCGLSAKTESHHYLGYEEKHWFDVRWLCQSCHRSIHRKAIIK